jgi:type II secretory pathway pseudopilin PulG
MRADGSPYVRRAAQRSLRPRRGLSLLEAVAALAIVGATSAGMLAATGAGLRTAARAQHAIEAEALAMELYARLAVADDAVLRALPDSLAGGRFPEPFTEYTWRASVRPQGEWMGLLTVVVEVQGPASGHRLSSALFRRAPIIDADGAP